MGPNERRIVCWVAVAALAHGCGGGGGTPDRTQPLPVESFVAMASGSDIHGSWTVPAPGDTPEIAGVVVVRLAGLPEAPVDGERYEVGEAALGGEVVYAGNGTEFEDLGLPVGDFSYVAFSRTSNFTYGPLAAAAARIPMATQTATLTIDLGAETVAVNAAGGSMGLAAGLSFSTGNTSGTVVLQLENQTAGIFFNPKLVVTSATDGTAADRIADITNTYGTLGTDPYFYFGPSNLGAGRLSDIVYLGFQNVDATTVLTVQLELVTSPMAIGGESWNSTGDEVLPLFDVDAEVEVGSLRSVPFGPNGFLRPDAGYITPDGHYLYMGSRVAAELTVFDLTTLSPVAILPISSANGRGCIPFLYAAPGGGTLYALFLDGAHSFRWGNAGSVGRGYDKRVEVVRIDVASLSITGRLRLSTITDVHDTGVRGRQFAVSPDGTTLAIPVMAYYDVNGVYPTANETMGAVHFVDLATLSEIDTDPATAGIQPFATGDVALESGGTGILNPAVVEWASDGLLLVGGTWDDSGSANPSFSPNGAIATTEYGVLEIDVAGGYGAVLYDSVDVKPVDILRVADGTIYMGGYPELATETLWTYSTATHSVTPVDAMENLDSARVIVPGPDASHVWINSLDNKNELQLIDVVGATVVSTLTSNRSMYGHWFGITPF